MAEKQTRVVDTGVESSTTPTTPDKTSQDLSGGQLEAAVVEEKAAPALGDERSIRGFKWTLAVLSILSSTFLFALDTTVVSSGLIP